MNLSGCKIYKFEQFVVVMILAATITEGYAICWIQNQSDITELEVGTEEFEDVTVI